MPLDFSLDGAEVLLVELDDDDDDDDNGDGDVVLAWSLPEVSGLPCPTHRNYTVPLKDDDGELHIEIRRSPQLHRAAEGR
jgi:hypothetical protein